MKNREISLLVPAETLAQRARDDPVAAPTAERGYRKLYLASVLQADKGVDFDFLQAAQMQGKTPQAR